MELSTNITKEEKSSLETELNSRGVGHLIQVNANYKTKGVEELLTWILQDFDFRIFIRDYFLSGTLEIILQTIFSWIKTHQNKSKQKSVWLRSVVKIKGNEEVGVNIVFKQKTWSHLLVKMKEKDIVVEIKKEAKKKSDTAFVWIQLSDNGEIEIKAQ